MEEWQKPETITLWIVIGVLFLLILLAFMFIIVRMNFRNIIAAKEAESQAKLEHQEHLLETTIRTQEKERQRIAADLHDAVIGKLTVLKLQQEGKQLDSESSKILEESINTARRISHDLSPPLLEFTPLPDLISELIDPWNKQFEIDQHFDVRTEFEHSNETKIQFTRILQELITNSHKHGEASKLQVHYRQSNQHTIFRLSDNGKGFETEAIKQGLGLQNIESRVQHLKGKYKVSSAPDKGATFLFTFNNQSL